MLSQRLKELESEAVVERQVFAETPVRIEYRLTQKGRELDQAVRMIKTWADEWVGLGSEATTDVRRTEEAAVAPCDGERIQAGPG